MSPEAIRRKGRPRASSAFKKAFEQKIYSNKTSNDENYNQLKYLWSLLIAEISATTSYCVFVIKKEKVLLQYLSYFRTDSWRYIPSIMPNWHYFFLLGASACVQLNQFEETITWCEKGLAVSFITDDTMKNIDLLQTLLLSFIPAFRHHLRPKWLEQMISLICYDNSLKRETATLTLKIQEE